MTISASDANELLCDNNTIKTHHVNRSDFFKENLAFQIRSLVKSNSQVMRTLNLVSLSVLITYLLDIVCMVQGEVSCQSPRGVGNVSKWLFLRKWLFLKKISSTECSDHSIFWFFGNQKATTAYDFPSVLFTSVSIFSILWY